MRCSGDFLLKMFFYSLNLYLNCIKSWSCMTRMGMWRVCFKGRLDWGVLTALSHTSVWTGLAHVLFGIETLLFYPCEEIVTFIQPCPHLLFLYSAERQHGNRSSCLSEKVAKFQGPQGNVLGRTLQNISQFWCCKTVSILLRLIGNSCIHAILGVML